MLDFCGIHLPHPYLVNERAQANLGLLYVLGAARKEGFETGFFNGAGMSPPAIAKNAPDAKVYGISATVVDYETAEKVARCLKASKLCKIILGGPVHTAIDYIDFDWFDSLAIGDGEPIIKQALTDNIDGAPQKIYHGYLDDIDWVSPAYDLWYGALGGKVLADEKYEETQSSVILTSRGCPFNCSFCCSKTICGGKVRFRKLDAVMEEVDYLVSRGVKVLRLSDENITTRKNRLAELCERLRPYHEQHGVVWRPSFRTDFCGLEIFKLMRRSGCHEASIGVESADPNVLDMVNKGTTVEQNKECLKLLGEAGIARRVLFMAGCPGTGPETLRTNARFILTQEYEVVSLTVFTPLPGAPVWEDPAAFRCDILPHAKELENLCFYFFGPTGIRDIKPFIDLWDYPYSELCNEVTTTRGLIQGIGKVNRG